MSIDYRRPPKHRAPEPPDAPVIEYLHPPRPRLPRPRWTAADVLGEQGQPPRYRGGLKAYQRDTKAHRIYRVWRAQFRKA